MSLKSDQLVFVLCVFNFTEIYCSLDATGARAGCHSELTPSFQIVCIPVCLVRAIRHFQLNWSLNPILIMVKR